MIWGFYPPNGVIASAACIHLSPFLEANVEAVIAVADVILRNDRVGIAHEG